MNRGLVAVFSVVAVIIALAIVVFGYFFVSAWPEASETEKTVAIIAGLVMIFGATFLVALPLLAVFLIGSASAGGAVDSLVRNVPANHVWVLRNVWKSDPEDGSGYEVKPEGLRFYVPKILHADEGFVSLAPRQLDTPPFRVNCTDGTNVDVDTRVTWRVRVLDEDVIQYVVNTKGENLDELLSQRVRVALNRHMSHDSVDVIKWGEEAKKEYGKSVTELAQGLLDSDGGKKYGINITINIENVMPLPEVQAAKSRRVAAQIEKEAAIDEAKAMKAMITETEANPTIVMVAQTIADAFRGRFPKKTSGKTE